MTDVPDLLPASPEAQFRLPSPDVPSLTGHPLPSTASWATSDTVTYAYDHADELDSVTDFNGNQIGISSTADGAPYSQQLSVPRETLSRQPTIRRAPRPR